MTEHGATRSHCKSLGCLAYTAIVVGTVTALGSASAQSSDAEKLFKRMADYVTSQKTIMVAFDTDIEVITPELEKIQFASSGKLLLSRPDKLRFGRVGGYADLEVIFDGRTITIYGKNLNTYAQIDSPGSVDDIIGRLRDNHNVAAPGADFLLSSLYDELIEDVIDAKHIGRGVIDGIECEHLAFRNADTDWQIWIELGARPIPRKYVITSKAVAGAPQYTLRIKDWVSDAAAPAASFVFKAPQDATRVPVESLSAMDEVPLGVIARGGRK